MLDELFGESIYTRRHPLLGGPCRTDGETCGTCAHLRRRSTPSGRTVYKCAMRGETRGAATDVRFRWPGCGWWRPAQAADGRG